MIQNKKTTHQTTGMTVAPVLPRDSSVSLIESQALSHQLHLPQIEWWDSFHGKNGDILPPIRGETRKTKKTPFNRPLYNSKVVETHWTGTHPEQPLPTGYKPGFRMHSWRCRGITRVCCNFVGCPSFRKSGKLRKLIWQENHDQQKGYPPWK